MTTFEPQNYEYLWDREHAAILEWSLSEVPIKSFKTSRYVGNCSAAWQESASEVRECGKID